MSKHSKEDGRDSLVEMWRGYRLLADKAFTHWHQGRCSWETVLRARSNRDDAARLWGEFWWLDVGQHLDGGHDLAESLRPMPTPGSRFFDIDLD